MLQSNRTVIRLLRNVCVLKTQLRDASYTQRESRMLNKLMTGKRKPNFKFTDKSTIMEKSSSFDITKKTSTTKISQRRTIVLNKMFMRHVTDIIASGPIGYELYGLGLEITKVNVCQRYHGLNIFWRTTAITDLALIEQKLESIKGKLRHELHQMQLLGNIPHLTFVRDTQLSRIDDLYNAIANADYGDDYQPNESKSKVKCDFDIRKPDENIESSDENSTILPMRQDVFGVNHAAIMGRIKQSMVKSKQAWKAYEDQTSQHSIEKPFTFATSFESIRQEQINTQQSQDVLKEFLVRRKLLRKQQKIEEMAFKESLDDLNQINQIDDNEDYHDDFNDEYSANETEFYQSYDKYEK